MEDSSAKNTAEKTTKTTARTPLGMSSFGAKEQLQFGHRVRLAMACMEGSSQPPGTEASTETSTKAMPSDTPSIRKKLLALSQDQASSMADLIELVLRFDELEGWKLSGASHCAAWMNLELGVGIQLSWEYLRVGRKLRTLPTTTALFRAGKLSWSKIRLICRVASTENEKLLCHAALDASVSDVVRLCAQYRWESDDNGKADSERALQQWEERSLHYSQHRNGNTTIRLSLPPELAQAFINSVEHSMNQLEDTEENTIAQRRADAALLMAESSLQAAGKEIAMADRYQVVISVDETELQNKPATTGERVDSQLPAKRATINGSTPISRDTARRIACDCRASTHAVVNGEPVSIGRKSRVWPAAIARAIKDRDQHCQYPGCSHTHNMQIHHIQHWAEGGATSIENGVLLCHHHHLLVHEGGYTIERIESLEQVIPVNVNDDNQTNIYSNKNTNKPNLAPAIDQEFIRQQNVDDIAQFDFEKQLRCDRESFEQIRKLSPTRFRFRVINAQGIDVRDMQDKQDLEFLVGLGGVNRDAGKDGDGDDYTRVYCAEPEGVYEVGTMHLYDQRH